MTNKVFVSHASKDAEFAHALVAEMEAGEASCWIAPRNVEPGADFASEIMHGIEGCDLFILLHSEAANASPHVLREVGRAASRQKRIIVLRLTQHHLSEGLEYFVGGLQWVSAENKSPAHAARLLIESARQQESDYQTSPSQRSGGDPLSRVGFDVVEIVLEASDHGKLMPTAELLQRLKAKDPHTYASLSGSDLVLLIKDAENRGFCPGLSRVDGGFMVSEPHISFKTRTGSEAKSRLAEAASQLVRSGNTLALDGGSTTLAIFDKLLAAVESEELRDLTVLTNSMSIVTRACEFTARHGYSDSNSPLRVNVIGGRLRAVTAAVEPYAARWGRQSRSLAELFRQTGRIDLSFVGANGITLKDGLTIPTANEVPIKKALLQAAKHPLVVADGAKFGLSHPHRLCALKGRTKVLTTSPSSDAGKAAYDAIAATSAASHIQFV